MEKKAMELSMNMVVIAILLLIVLVVIISIFSGTMSDIANAFRGHTDKAGEGSDRAMDNIGFFKCEDDDLKCREGNVYKCKDKEWNLEKRCDKGCQEGKCKTE